MSKFALSLLIILLYISCSENQDKKLFTLETKTGIDFTNKVEDGQLENSFLFRNFYNGGGVAIGDINNDGLADIFLTSNMGENKLYLNKGNWKFSDITQQAGIRQDSMWSAGVVFADINSDGWLDIYVCNSGHMTTGHRRNQLFINNRNNTFTESAAKYGLDVSAYCTQASFFDYDLDGDLDCFIIANSPMPVNTLGYTNKRDLPAKDWDVADFVKDGGDHLYRNDNGHYTEVSKEAGIHGTLMSFGLGVSVSDVNNDGYPDVYVANDSYERDYLYINQKNGTFKDDFEECIKQTSFSSMGADIADINNDGNQDIFTTDMLPEDDYRLKTLGAFDNIDLYRRKEKVGFYHQFMKNCLQLNNGDGTFSDVANYAGVCATDWSWGAIMFDADNDGLNDIYVCNGINKDVTNLDFMDFFANDVIQKMVLTGKKDNVDEVLKHIPVQPMINKAYKNTGNLKFSDQSANWGFTEPSFSNGAAYGDLDNDGDLDLVINNENQQAFIYSNNSNEITKNKYIGFKLAGKSPNTFAIGSKITVYAGAQKFTREQMPSRGFQSCVDYKQLIGVGAANKIDSVIITWPDVSSSVLYNLKTGSVYVVTETQAEKKFLIIDSSSTLFTQVSTTFQKHVDDDYVDFYYERNIPAMLSREGPKVACGDVNGDGVEDIYIGGTKDHPGQVYIQTADENFVLKSEKDFEQFASFEDEAVLLFDCDKDGDLDLFVGPGGNSAMPFTKETQLRLFKNDGKGNFTIYTAAFPNNSGDIAVASAYDYDNDGDLDLFVGSRNTTRNYGITPSSYIFKNDGNGNFTDVAKTLNPQIANIGMVTSAVWADVNGDNKKELIVAGEWMPVQIFSYAGNDKFTSIKTSLSDLYGWWESVAVADLNNDGREDLVLGNLGENFYLHPDKSNPVKLFINDFNGNGNQDKILTRTIDNKDVPVFLKHDMQDEIPSIKKQNLQHKDYATRSVKDLFGDEMINKSTVKTFNYTSSVIAYNNGKNDFTIQKLPYQLQLSIINSIVCKDVNGDGKLDIIAGGNRSGFLPQFGRLDASFGDVLINDGKGNFTWQPSVKSGVLVSGEVRDIAYINGKHNNFILFLRNDDFPILYKMNNH